MDFFLSSLISDWRNALIFYVKHFIETRLINTEMFIAHSLRSNSFDLLLIPETRRERYLEQQIRIPCDASVDRVC